MTSSKHSTEAETAFMEAARTQAIEKLQRFHELGSAAPRHRENFGEGKLVRQAEELRINADTLRKGRAFADPEKGYSRAELKQLIRQLQSHDYVNPNWKFGISHMIRLISVPKDGGHRLSLQQELITKEWSCAQLDDVIRQRYKLRDVGGRRRRVPEDSAGLLTQVAKECDRWNRWFLSLKRDDNTPPLSRLPRSVKSQIRQITELISRLKASADRARDSHKEPK